MTRPVTPAEQAALLRKAANQSASRYSAVASNLSDLFADVLDDVEAGVPVRESWLAMAENLRGERS